MTTDTCSFFMVIQQAGSNICHIPKQEMPSACHNYLSLLCNVLVRLGLLFYTSSWLLAAMPVQHSSIGNQ